MQEGDIIWKWHGLWWPQLEMIEVAMAGNWRLAPLDDRANKSESLVTSAEGRAGAGWLTETNLPLWWKNPSRAYA